MCSVISNNRQTCTKNDYGFVLKHVCNSVIIRLVDAMCKHIGIYRNCIYLNVLILHS